MLTEALHMIVTSQQLYGNKELIDILAFDIFADKKKKKRCSQTFLKMSDTLMWGQRSSFMLFPARAFSEYPLYCRHLTTFSNCAIITVLLIALRGIHKTVTAKQPTVNLFQ